MRSLRRAGDGFGVGYERDDVCGRSRQDWHILQTGGVLLWAIAARSAGSFLPFFRTISESAARVSLSVKSPPESSRTIARRSLLRMSAEICSGEAHVSTAWLSAKYGYAPGVALKREQIHLFRLAVPLASGVKVRSSRCCSIAMVSGFRERRKLGESRSNTVCPLVCENGVAIRSTAFGFR